MLHKSLIKVAKDLRLGVDQVRNNKFRVVSNKYYLEWYVQEDSDEAVAVCMTRNGLQDNLMTDYFPGFFPKTLKQIKKYLEMKDDQ